MSVARSYFILPCGMLFPSGAAFPATSTTHVFRRTSLQGAYRDGGVAVTQRALLLSVTEDLEARAHAWAEEFNATVLNNPTSYPVGSRLSLLRVVHGTLEMGYNAEALLVFSVEWDPWTPVDGLSLPPGKGYGCPVLLVAAGMSTSSSVSASVYLARTSQADDEVLSSPHGGSLDEILQAVADAAGLR